ncbi:hypothetical protein B8W99_07150 [Peribacillus simplex]|nr:hypothetical protein B8W99_07150 [Peribacillus simplex]
MLFLKRNYFRLIGAEVRDSCGSSGTGETPQAFTPRRLTARPAESEHLEGKSTTLHYFVNSNKVCENSLFFEKGLHLKFNNKIDGSGCARPLRKKHIKGGPRRRKPRKVSAWSEINVRIVKTCIKL